MKIQTPNSPCTDNTLFLGHFNGFLQFVVWRIVDTSEYIKAIFCASEGAFLFFFCLCNVFKYCFLFFMESK